MSVITVKSLPSTLYSVALYYEGENGSQIVLSEVICVSGDDPLEEKEILGRAEKSAKDNIAMSEQSLRNKFGTNDPKFKLKLYQIYTTVLR